jgi:REP element-mobilizing transposase RayT
MPFHLFDPEAEFNVIQRRLPHWEQPGAVYFMTWRTKDSLPKEVLERWFAERDDWLRRHGIDVPGERPPGSEWRDQLARLPEHIRRTFRSEIIERWEVHLDACHGACVLRRPELAKIVADSLLHFDGQRYTMGDFVVMPNHVHLLVAFPDEGQLLAQAYSWKKFTATQINRRLHQRGEFWQTDSFDHLVRSQEEFEHYRRYIAENPLKAGLREGEYYYYRRPDTVPVTE